MTPYELAVARIIKEQQNIIGPLAIDQARMITGMEVNSEANVKITGNGKEILGSLVQKYAEFFGQASIEVCKDAIRDMKSSISAQDLPDVLK